MGKMGFFTDTTICIGCKACEVACKQWNQLPADGFRFTGHSYDNTTMLSATTWRHVAFVEQPRTADGTGDRKSTRLNSSHVAISYAVFCLKKKKHKIITN